MGMAASQARLLSITARLSDNEANGQALSYTKQRLADQTEQINQAYNDALAATKLQVLTGFNNNVANYEDISYGLMTGFNTVACGKQYIVTDIKGRILVTQEQANAYKVGHGNFNIFLAELGFTQGDLAENQRVNNENWVILDNDGNEITSYTDENGNEVSVSATTSNAYDNNADTLAAKQQIHEAWDKYLKSVGLSFYDEEHEFENDEIVFGYEYFDRDNNPANLNDEEQTFMNGFVTYSYQNADGSFTKRPLNYEGTTDAQRELYDYAQAITAQYYCSENYIPHQVNIINGEEQIVERHDVNNQVVTKELKSINDLEAGYIQYLKNIFDKMRTCGFFTEESEADTINNVTRYKNGTKSVSWFEQQLKDGKLFLQNYSATEKKFVSVTISEDNAIQEVEDERAIAQAESKYNQDLAALEKKDQMIDLELKKLDTEHNALQTEYDQVKKVIDKNVEKSFNLFS